MVVLAMCGLVCGVLCGPGLTATPDNQAALAAAPFQATPEPTGKDEDGLDPPDFSFVCEAMHCTFQPKTSYPGYAECSWNAGDGSGFQDWNCQANFPHTYKKAGNYNTTFRVADSRTPGGEVVTKTRTVKLAAPEPTQTTKPVPTETPTPTSTPTPVPTSTPTSTPTKPPTSAPGPTTTRTSTPRPTGTQTLEPDPTAPPSDPDPSATPTIDPTDVPGQEAKSYMDQCGYGTVAYSPPTSMWQGEKTEFTVRVALAGSPQDLSTELPTGSPVVTDNPKICELMRADLTGLGFDIERKSNPSGLISLSSDGSGGWGWYITPRETGRKTLTVSLVAPAPDGGDLEIETYTREIDVNVGFAYLVGVVAKEWAAPLGLTIPVIVGALGGLYLRSKRVRHRPTHGPHEGRHEAHRRLKGG